jgi:putative transposase
MAIDLKSLPITRAELETALTGETRAWVRKRLIAIRAVINGQSPTGAALAAGASAAGVCKWLRRVQQHGCAALLRDGRAERHNSPPLMPEQVSAVRAEIAVALKRRPRWKLMNRLRAIDAALAGQPREAAAAVGSVKPGTLNYWIAQIRHKGVAATLEKWEAPHKSCPLALDADATALRACATSEKNLHMRKRLLALACLAEGLSPDDAAVRTGMSDCTVRDYRHRFQQGGIAAVRGIPYMGGTTKLKPKKLQTVAAIVRANANITLGELRGRIETEFGVRYTPAGLKNMLKKQLGISLSMPFAHSPQTEA